MAAPSLGYAMGLNVETKDIFGKLGPQLSQNLANWSAQKERAAKEKEAKEEKWLERLMEVRQNKYNQRVDPEAKDAFKTLDTETMRMIEAGEPNSKIVQAWKDYFGKIADVKQKSDLLDDNYKIWQQPTTLKSKAATKLFTTPDLITPEDLVELRVTGIVGDPQTNLWMFDPTTRMPTSERLRDYKLTEDQVIANQQKQMADKANYDKAVADAKNNKTAPPPVPESLSTSLIYKGKKIPGYDQMAGEVLTPEKGYFISNVVNSMLTDQAAVDNALVELESTLPKGQRLATLVIDKMNKNGISEEEAAYAVAAEYIVDKHYPTWASENAKFFQASKTAPIPRSGPTSGKQEPKSQVGEMRMLTNTGFDNASKKKLSPDDALELSEYQSGQNYLGSGLGVMVETKTTEPFSITVDGALTQVNPYALFYNRDDGKYYMQYQLAASTTGIGVALGNFKVTKMGERDIKSLQANKNYQDAMNDLINAVNNKGGSSGGKSNVTGFGGN